VSQIVSQPMHTTGRRLAACGASGFGVEAMRGDGWVYLRRRAMIATMSCATPMRRAARAISDGSFGPLLRRLEVERLGITGANKGTLLRIGMRVTRHPRMGAAE
jgi:hypothetical protein